MLLALFELSLFQLDSPFGYLLVGIPAAFVTYIAAGIFAWHRRPSNRMGFLIVLAGFAIYLGGIANTGVPSLAAIGTLFATLALPAVVQLLLSFPTGRLVTAPARVLVVSGYVVAILFQAPLYLLDAEGPFPPFALTDDPSLLSVFRELQSAVGAVVMIFVAIVLGSRLQRADHYHRRVLGPIYVYGIATVLFIPFSSIVLTDALGVDAGLRGILQFAVVTGVPIAFAAVILFGGFARTGELEELSSWLAAKSNEREPIQTALSRALGDPSLSLYFWSVERQEFVDAAGNPTTPKRADPRRGWAEITLEARLIGAIAYDSSLLNEQQQVERAGNIVAIAMERQRLTAVLLATQNALVRSRERIVDSTNRERRRLARDLHDGLQVRLVLLALEAQRISKIADNPTTTIERARALRVDIDEAAAELRNLVHGLVPAALIERGLGAAAADLADRMPIPTAVDIHLAAGRLPEGVETAAYFVVAEGLSNIAKHAEASAATVQLGSTGSILRVRITDDGRGGAEVAAGTGLLGLADRVDVIGGTMSLQSNSPKGTILTVEIPCAS